MGKTLTNYWFDFNQNDGTPLIDVLIGQTPEWNRKACKFLLRIGWHVLGTIPYLADGEGMVLSYAIRSE